MLTKICTLRTDVLELREKNRDTEGGIFEVDVLTDVAKARQSGDARGYINRAIAFQLRVNIETTGVPREFWIAEFSQWARSNLNFPEKVRMG